MARKPARKEGSSRREPRARRRLKSRILVVCGAQKTEKSYFEGLRSHVRNPAVTVKIETKPVCPTQVVEHAEKLWRNDRDTLDEV
jgi:hypothetical protein